jgi:predicted HTH transcriptional regulator
LDFLEKGEDNFTEFKSSLRYCLRQQKPMPYVEHGILKTINAFLNSEGGTLIIGVDDDANVLGLDNDYNSFSKKGRDGFLLHFDNLVINALGKEQQADMNIKFEDVDDKEFAIVEVSSSNKPVFMSANGKKEFYVRHAASSQAYDISEAYEYINKHWN